MVALQGAGGEQRLQLPRPARPLPPSPRAPFGANDPSSAAGLRAGTQARGSAAKLGSRLSQFAGPAGGLGLPVRGGRAGKASIVPAAAEALTAGEETAAPAPSAPGSGTNISSYKKIKKEK